jgi:hypothetical protein
VICAQWSEREPEFDLALQTGLRWVEQYGLQREHVNVKRDLLTIPLAKSAHRVRVPINSEAEGPRETPNVRAEIRPRVSGPGRVAPPLVVDGGAPCDEWCGDILRVNKPLRYKPQHTCTTRANGWLV